MFKEPIGYRHENVESHGKLLVRDEPVASILAETLEGRASRRFASTAELKRHLDAIPECQKPKSGEVQFQSLQLILRRLIYTGLIDHKPWGISLVQGHHEPLISIWTHK